jgi:hypothetical protein
MKKIFSVIVLFFLFFGQGKLIPDHTKNLWFFYAVGASAEGLKVSPSVIDEKAKARDILKYTVKLKNEKLNKIEVYAVLYDILPDGSRLILGPSDLDKKNSITKWTSIKRGVIALEPGQEIEVPLQIDVDLTAVSGVYHSVIAFSEGSNKNLAEVNVDLATEILVNIEINDQIIEKAQIEKFNTKKNIFTKYPVAFDLQIKNNGNTTITPSGTILIYNRRDQQVGQVDVNSLATVLEKDTSKNFAIQWTNDSDGFGKFKAKLEVEYGTKNKRDLQDTVYFWVFPLKYLALFFVILFAFTFLLTYLLFKKSRCASGVYSDVNSGVDDEEESGTINLKD